MNTVALYVSRMSTVGACVFSLVTLACLSQFAFGAAALFAGLTALLAFLAVTFHMAYNRFKAELRQMPDEEDPNDYHLYPYEDVGDGSGRRVQVYSRGDVGGHPS